jgi:hypothetical protein
MSGFPNKQNMAAGAIPVWMAVAPPAGGGPTPKGYQQITTALSGATALTVPTGATLAIVNVEGTSVRWRDDGTNPSSTVGMVLAAGTTTPFVGDLSALKFIRTAAGSEINVSYYG